MAMTKEQMEQDDLALALELQQQEELRLKQLDEQREASLALALKLQQEQQELTQQAQIETDEELARSLAGLSELEHKEKEHTDSHASIPSSAIEILYSNLHKEYGQLLRMLPDVEKVGLQESNVHLFSKAGPICMAYGYAKALDAKYKFSTASSAIEEVCGAITKVMGGITAELERDAQVKEKGGDATQANERRQDIIVLTSNVPRVIANITASKVVDGETGVSLQELVQRTWSLVSHPYLSSSNSLELVVRNLSLNIETGGGCIPGIIVRLMVPYIYSIRILMEGMLLQHLPIPVVNAVLLLPKPFVPAYNAQTMASSVPTVIKAASSTAAVHIETGVDKGPYIKAALAKRAEILDLKLKLGQSLPKDKGAILADHSSTLEGWSVAKIREIEKQDCGVIEVLRKQLASKPKF